mmetsp:Transcript_4079/g.11517  ORF Transcript_4079/g.11517 Transcript_4079/m.11517 type:complete len:503 (-) Transcript_4079:1002-2510(-)
MVPSGSGTSKRAMTSASRVSFSWLWALALLSLSSAVRYSAASSEKDLNIDWISECGCTGIEIESVGLTTNLWKTGFKQLRLNHCDHSNPRCSGQTSQTDKALKRLVSPRGGEKGSADVVVVHLAYLGICGIPPVYRKFAKCKLKTTAPTKSGFFSFFGWPRANNEKLRSAMEACERPYLIARAMGEEDSIDLQAAHKCNSLFDEVWVPSTFHMGAFTSGGVEKERIHVVPEIVDLRSFNPATVRSGFEMFPQDSPVSVRLLSVFKWEPRKNWSQLLLAFVYAFLLRPEVGLFIKTSRYMNANPTSDTHHILSSLIGKIMTNPSGFIDEHSKLTGIDHDKLRHDLSQEWVLNTNDPRCVMNRVVIVDKVLPANQMPMVFKAAHGFVLPSHGEGWGLPLMEAMAMELPAIGTKFGGNVDFMDPSCSLLVDVKEKARGMGGASWAVPDNDQLMTHMLWIANNQDAAKDLGKRARRHLQQHFRADMVTATMQQRLKEIHHTLLGTS